LELDNQSQSLSGDENEASQATAGFELPVALSPSVHPSIDRRNSGHHVAGLIVPSRECASRAHRSQRDQLRSFVP
jgi:hypothetical protein